jgi:hypothetical protein
MPSKIKFFMWYVKLSVMLTKDNLVRRNWKGNKLCVFRTHPESIQHLFFDCHFAKFLWRTVVITFNVGSPNSVGHLFITRQIVWYLNWESSYQSGLLLFAGQRWNSRNGIRFL